MTERYNQVMQFLYDHVKDIDYKSTELHEIAIMMRNCLNELADTQKKLDICVDALNAITATPLNSRVIHDVGNKALEQIKDKEQQ